MEERRKIDRVTYTAKSVMVICDTQEKLEVEVRNMSPMGMGVYMAPGSRDIVGKDIIIVTDTLIMYATVLRMDKQEDGGFIAGIEARRFTQDVLEYLFEHIG